MYNWSWVSFASHSLRAKQSRSSSHSPWYPFSYSRYVASWLGTEAQDSFKKIKMWQWLSFWIISRSTSYALTVKLSNCQGAITVMCAEGVLSAMTITARGSTHASESATTHHSWSSLASKPSTFSLYKSWLSAIGAVIMEAWAMSLAPMIPVVWSIIRAWIQHEPIGQTYAPALWWRTVSLVARTATRAMDLFSSSQSWCSTYHSPSSSASCLSSWYKYATFALEWQLWRGLDRSRIACAASPSLMKLRRRPNRKSPWTCPASRMPHQLNPSTLLSMSPLCIWTLKQTTLCGLMWMMRSLRKRRPHITKPYQQTLTSSQAMEASSRVSQLSVFKRMKVNTHSHRTPKICCLTLGNRAFKGNAIGTVLSCAIIRLTC